MIRHGDLHGPGATPAGITLFAPALSTRRRTGRRATIVAGACAAPGSVPLADQLLAAAEARGLADRLTVLRPAPRAHDGAGPSAFAAARALLGRGSAESVLASGLAGAATLAAAATLSRRRLVLHLDGHGEAKAADRHAARAVSTACAIRAADALVADNAALADAIAARHGTRPRVIAYGAEPWRPVGRVLARPADLSDLHLPPSYALAVARPEPAANLPVLLHAFSRLRGLPLVVACDWSATRHGRRLHAAWDGAPNIHLIETPTDPDRLHCLRSDAWLHVHGQEGGATQTLVETMALSAPILTWDSAQNRAVTAGTAETFHDRKSLAAMVRRYAAEPGLCLIKGATHGAVARRRYRRDAVADAWFDVLDL